MTARADRGYTAAMGATQIIEAIKQLNPTEQFEVIRFAKELDTVRKLTPEELGDLAERMVNATDPAEKARLTEEIVRGFYGDEPEDA